MQSSDTDKCLCENGNIEGILVKKIKPNTNMELWAACKDDPNNAYPFTCNHKLVGKDEEVLFPTHPVSKYSSESIHMHVGQRREDPHGTSEIPWNTIRLTPCQCKK